MEFREFFSEAKDSITIIGTNPLIPHLERSAEFFSDILNLQQKLTLKILYESDLDNFNQSLCYNSKYTKDPTSYAILQTHRNRISGTFEKPGLYEEIGDALEGNVNKKELLQNVFIRQQNLRISINIIQVDNKIWISIPTFYLPKIDSYVMVEENDKKYEELKNYIRFCFDEDAGGAYLSKTKDELIWVYDTEKLPRGIFPRSSFYTTSYGRYVVWVFVFNQKGELLLHKRSETTKDNRGLWDKSIGGHVDLADASTSITARRELVEEMFLPEAEFTQHFKADIGDIIDFGEWRPQKISERYFGEAFKALGPADWIMFRATDKKGLPLTINRVSNRLITENDKVINKKTVFYSDVFFIIAPRGQLDTDEQMKASLELSEKRGVASDHKLISIQGLKDWISDSENKGEEKQLFTDDLLFINDSHVGLLEGFSEFIKYLFK